MPTKSLAELTLEIDLAVNPAGGEPRNTGPALNALLRSLATELTALPAAADPAPGLDVFLVPAEVRAAVVQGTYNEASELTTALPTELAALAQAGQEFSFANALYKYMPGDAGTLTWVRTFKKGPAAAPAGGSGGASAGAETLGESLLHDPTFTLPFAYNGGGVGSPQWATTGGWAQALDAAGHPTAVASEGDYFYQDVVVPATAKYRLRLVLDRVDQGTLEVVTWNQAITGSYSAAGVYESDHLLAAGSDRFHLYGPSFSGVVSECALRPIIEAAHPTADTPAAATTADPVLSLALSGQQLNLLTAKALHSVSLAPLVPAAAPLYAGPGPATDGPLTQQATTAALALKADRVLATTRTTWYVEDVGQAQPGDGSGQAPFRTLAQALAACQPGHTVYYTPKATFNPATQRAECAENLTITKSITLYFTAPVAMTGEIAIGDYPNRSAAPLVATFHNLVVAARLVLIKQWTNGHRITFVNAQVVAGGYIEAYGCNVSGGVDTMVFNNLTANTVGNGKGLFFFNEAAGYAQPALLYLNGGFLRTGGNLIDVPVGYGPDYDSRVYVSASTFVELPADKVLSPLPVLLVDQRPAAVLRPAAALRAAVAAGAFASGELQGAQPAGSLPGMRFVDAAYRYEFGPGMSDPDGPTGVWYRCAKA